MNFIVKLWLESHKVEDKTIYDEFYVIRIDNNSYDVIHDNSNPTNESGLDISKNLKDAFIFNDKNDQELIELLSDFKESEYLFMEVQ